MGRQAVAQDDGEDMDQNQFSKEDHMSKLMDIPSLPFQIDFSKPVIKVECGDTYSGLLTANGQVFTWGYNKFGALGIDSSQILL
jgi:alpha-tubulin suppressor-like RCC1 family protein